LLNQLFENPGSNPVSMIHRKRGARPLFLWMAEREGFEPS
jgi:hypothetical protein